MKEFEYSPLVGVKMGATDPGRDPAWWPKNFPGVPFRYNPYTGVQRHPAGVKADPEGFAIVPPHAEDRLLAAVLAAVPAPVAPAQPRILADDGHREDYPLYDGLFAYFPAALCEIARWSVVGNRKHNGPDAPLHWAREKSTDHENKILRHLLDARQVDKDGFVEAVALAWRALALCQTILEERGWAEGPNARRKTAEVQS